MHQVASCECVVICMIVSCSLIHPIPSYVLKTHSSELPCGHTFLCTHQLQSTPQQALTASHWCTLRVIDLQPSISMTMAMHVCVPPHGPVWEPLRHRYQEASSLSSAGWLSHHLHTADPAAHRLFVCSAPSQAMPDVPALSLASSSFLISASNGHKILTYCWIICIVLITTTFEHLLLCPWALLVSLSISCLEILVFLPGSYTHSGWVL